MKKITNKEFKEIINNTWTHDLFKAKEVIDRLEHHEYDMSMIYLTALAKVSREDNLFIDSIVCQVIQFIENKFICNIAYKEFLEDLKGIYRIIFEHHESKEFSLDFLFNNYFSEGF